MTSRWIAEFVGYPQAAGGILVSGSTMANFTAVLTALRHVAPYDSTPDGLQAAARRGRFLVYMADHEGHVSVTRVADMLNLGRRAVRLVPSRDDFTMDPEALDRMLEEDRRHGDLPFCVVAQLGSVNVGAVDPIADLADVCGRHGVWLHGDGACGLLAAGLAETAERFRGLERADSVSFDAHKWLGVPHDCGVVLVRQREHLRRAFSIAAPYLGEDPEGEGATDYRDYGPQMSRAYRALKVWMVLRSFGAAGLREVSAQEPPPGASSPWARGRASGLRGAARRICGRVALRMSICSHRTLERDVEATFEALAGLGRRLAADAGLGEAGGESTPLVANP